MRRSAIVAISLVGFVATACSANIAGTPVGAPLAKTESVILNPFTSAGPASTFTITAQTQGDCQASSVNYGNPSARRCFTADSRVLDPCYVPAEGPRDTALCIRGPEDDQAIELTITSDDPSFSEQEVTGQDPWAIKLVSGAVCVMLGGATTSVAGLRMNYGCPDGTALYGSPDRSQPVWTIFWQRTMSDPLEEVRARTVFY